MAVAPDRRPLIGGWDMEADRPSPGELTISRTFKTKLGEARLSVSGMDTSDTKMLYMLCNYGVERALLDMLLEAETDLDG